MAKEIKIAACGAEQDSKKTEVKQPDGSKRREQGASDKTQPTTGQPKRQW